MCLQAQWQLLAQLLVGLQQPQHVQQCCHQQHVQQRCHQQVPPAASRHQMLLLWLVQLQPPWQQVMAPWRQLDRQQVLLLLMQQKTLLGKKVMWC